MIDLAIFFLTLFDKDRKQEYKPLIIEQKEVKSLKKAFPFDYLGGGYFRRKGIEKGKSTEILHGSEAIEYLYSKLTE